MSDDQSVTAGWVLEYVNAREFLGRYNGQWTKGGIGTALILPSSEEAEQALDSLLSEANQRIRADGARRFWFDLYGGLVVVTEVEVVTRRKPRPISEETTQTDENRVSFAAGYSQALDDQAKGLT